MMFEVFSIRDSKVGFMNPTFEINCQVAVRNFVHAVQNSDSVLFSHARDFDLYRIGRFDSEQGRMIPDDIPELVCSGASCLKG